MSDIGALVAVLVPALLLYLLIPGGGAFLVRARWRRFREQLRAARAARVLDYGDHAAGSDEVAMRFAGRLEAMEGDGSLWIGDGRLSVLVHLARVPVYLMSGPVEGSVEGPDHPPRVLFWKDLTALAEGTPVLVFGRVEEADGTFVFGAHGSDRPLVILHDGRAEQLIRRALWAGRQRNEFWNHLTPVSLLAGMVAETLLAVTIVQNHPLTAVVALVLALLPVLPLFPPGVLAFYWYRRLWRVGRRLRAQRDVRATQIPEAGFSHRAVQWEAAAVLCLLAGLGANAYLAAALIALLLR